MSAALRRPDAYELSKVVPENRFLVLYDFLGNGQLRLRGGNKPTLYKTFKAASRLAMGEDRQRPRDGAVLLFELSRLTPIVSPAEATRLARRPLLDVTLDVSEHELAERMSAKWAEYALTCKGLF